MQTKLYWTRRQSLPDGGDIVEEQWIDNADWHKEMNDDVVSYDEPEETSETSPLQTTYRIRPSELHMTRTGEVRWDHIFREGETAASTVSIGATELPVEVTTKSLSTHVTDEGGEIQLSYDLVLFDEMQTVSLHIEFGEKVKHHESSPER